MTRGITSSLVQFSTSLVTTSRVSFLSSETVVHQITPHSILMPAGIPGVRSDGSAGASADEAAAGDTDYVASLCKSVCDEDSFGMAG